MKFQIFAAFALSLFFFVACQNNSGSAGSSTDATSADSINMDTLSKYLQFDFYEGRALSYKYKPQYTEALQMIQDIKSIWSTLSPADQDKMKAIIAPVQKFTNPYEIHRNSTTQLEALMTSMENGTAVPAATQKEYETVRATMLENGKIMVENQNSYDLAAVRSEFEAFFKAANKKATGAN